MNEGINAVLDDLDERARASLRTPVQIRDSDHFPSVEEIKVDTVWIRVRDVVALFADLKNSTALNFRKHAQTSARLYEAVMSNCVRAIDRFDPAFVDIQGDGLFALFHGERSFQRGMCAGITLKTFSERKLVPAIENWEQVGDRFPETGLKIGMHAGVIAVKKVGVRDTNEPVWAGKPVNWAAKCAAHADRNQLIVSQAVYAKFESNDYVTHSCGCTLAGRGTGTPRRIWVDEYVDSLPQDQMRCKRLISRWCEHCGNEFCVAIIAGKTHRHDVSEGLAA
jgi:class 3 adenylate cyclase